MQSIRHLSGFAYTSHQPLKSPWISWLYSGIHLKSHYLIDILRKIMSGTDVGDKTHLTDYGPKIDEAQAQLLLDDNVRIFLHIYPMMFKRDVPLNEYLSPIKAQTILLALLNTMPLNQCTLDKAAVLERLNVIILKTSWEPAKQLNFAGFRRAIAVGLLIAQKCVLDVPMTNAHAVLWMNANAARSCFPLLPPTGWFLNISRLNHLEEQFFILINYHSHNTCNLDSVLKNLLNLYAILAPNMHATLQVLPDFDPNYLPNTYKTPYVKLFVAAYKLGLPPFTVFHDLWVISACISTEIIDKLKQRSPNNCEIIIPEYAQWCAHDRSVPFIAFLNNLVEPPETMVPTTREKKRCHAEFTLPRIARMSVFKYRKRI